MLLRRKSRFWRTGLNGINKKISMAVLILALFAFILNGCGGHAQMDRAPEVSSFDALISAVPVFPASTTSSLRASYPVPFGSFTTFISPCNTRSDVSCENASGIQYVPSGSCLCKRYGLIRLRHFGKRIDLFR